MKRTIVWVILGIVLVILASLGGWMYWEYHVWSTPWGSEKDSFLIEIGEGKSARQIAAMLREKGVLHNTHMFLIMADLRGIGNKLKAGEYQVKGTQSPYEILDMLATGKQFYRSLVIPEGFTQVEIAKRCAETEICSVTDFLAKCRSSNLFSFVVAQAPDGANSAIEGVLFPNTYHLFRNTPADKVLERMTKQFEEKMQSIYNEAVKKSEERNTPWWWKEDNLPYPAIVHRIVVLASIIEKEAKRDEDRPMVASVFVNRIKKNMPLQADSTLHYAIGDWSRPLTADDLKKDSPYNTYVNPGLPPAAICNPGEAALRAACMPADSTNLFFITMNNGETKFTANYDEFLTWKKQYKSEKNNGNTAGNN